MFKRITSAVVLVSVILLAGCAGQGYYVAAQDPRNPYSFIQIAGRVPSPPPPLCVKDDGDFFKVSCPSGQLNMRKVGSDRQYSCVQQNGSVIAPIKSWLPHPDRNQCPQGVVDQNQTASQFGNGGGAPVLDSLSQYCQPNGCGKDQYGNWVKN